MDETARSEAFFQHIGLVYAVSRRFLGRGTDYEDLVQIGAIGLLRALKNYDPARKTAFSTYAVPVIAGEIRSALRENTRVKLSRKVLKQAAALRDAQNTLGCDAPIGILAHAAGLSEEEAAAAFYALDPPQELDGETATFADPATETDFERLYDRMTVQAGLKHLCDADRRLLALRYDHRLSQEQTGRILGLSQVQVSRAEKRILRFLREKLA